MMNKKGFNLQDLAPLAIAFVIIAVVLGIGSTVMESIRIDQCPNYWNTTNANAPFCSTATNNSAHSAGTYAENSSLAGMSSLATLSSWLPTIAVIVAAAVVIGIIVLYFKFQ